MNCPVSHFGRLCIGDLTRNLPSRNTIKWHQMKISVVLSTFAKETPGEGLRREVWLGDLVRVRVPQGETRRQ